ncbi:hypothetical protein UES1_104 [Escherichia phage UE-S1]|nr:hypothetical protein UES1_104 [Escherichia phage UE-S1]
MKIFSGHMFWIPENPGLYANWHLEKQSNNEYRKLR